MLIDSRGSVRVIVLDTEDIVYPQFVSLISERLRPSLRLLMGSKLDRPRTNEEVGLMAWALSLLPDRITFFEVFYTYTGETLEDLTAE